MGVWQVDSWIGNCPGADAYVWRYLTFDRFKYLWQGRLYMRRLDCLEMDDQEGRWPEGVEQLMFNPPVEDQAGMKQALEDQRRLTFVSCWTVRHREQRRMWQEYVGPRGGVAVRTRFRDLRSSLDGAGWDVAIGGVRYVDRIDRAWVGRHPRTNTFVLSFQKRCQYSWEQEVRVAQQLSDVDDAEVGRSISIDLHLLQPTLVVSRDLDASETEWVRSVSRLVAGTQVVESQVA